MSKHDAPANLYQDGLFCISRLVGERESGYVVTIKASEAPQMMASRRRHDLDGALRTLQLAMEGIENGYRFDDDVAQKKLQIMKEALAVLQQECQLSRSLLAATT